MTRANRVDPLGRIRALDFRGSFMGNRGILHDQHQQVVRHQASRAWIICRVHFRGRHREVMQPDTWTELFFWDEACALAAGHRPCFECRHADATRFRDLFRRVTGRLGATAADMDARLAAQRRRPRGAGPDEPARDLPDVLARTLPTGAMVLHADQPHLVADDGLRPWGTRGYGPAVEVPDHQVRLLTPAVTVDILQAGYDPVVRAT